MHDLEGLDHSFRGAQSARERLVERLVAETLRWMADKIIGLRVFPDEDGRMNLDLGEAGGGLLVVSQFTLYGDVSRGRRPSFVGAAPPDQARELYARFLAICAERDVPVAAGEFGGTMQVELVNSGPVTLVIER